MSNVATHGTAPVPKPARTTGSSTWFGLMVGSWIAVGVLAATSGETLTDIWNWVTGLSLWAEILLWIGTLPWMLALAVWESSWDGWLRILLVVCIALGWTVVSKRA